MMIAGELVTPAAALDGLRSPYDYTVKNFPPSTSVIVIINWVHILPNPESNDIRTKCKLNKKEEVSGLRCFL